jgi:hypothetical protein
MNSKYYEAPCYVIFCIFLLLYIVQGQVISALLFQTHAVSVHPAQLVTKLRVHNRGVLSCWI